MVEIDLSPLDIPEEGLRKKLREFYNMGFSWINFGASGDYYQFFGPNFSAYEKDIIHFFTSLKFLEVGNKEQLEVLKCLELLRTLKTVQHKKMGSIYLDSGYLMD